MMKLLAALSAAIAAALGFGAGRINHPHHPTSAFGVVASCQQGNPQVFYTVPASTTPLAISTNLAGSPLASWTEPAGNGRPPVVLGLPNGFDGMRFTVFEGAQSATVFIPRC